MKKNNRKTFAVIGMIVSVAVVLMGVLTISGSFGGDTHYAGSSYFYDSGYASFGGDFYTYVNNNAAEAADAAQATSSNVRELVQLMKNVCGIFLMGFGLFGLCHFGILASDCPVAEQKKEEPAAEMEVPAQEPEAPDAE